MFGLISKLRDRPESFQVSHVTWDMPILQASARLPLLFALEI
jgi:hypothetical protein